ncbi:MAG TPA: pyridoxamine 5'-phosphate oxidase family protein [Burkholderiaceae bacterium]|nr:pyridoxamine 5'-phosphate oxidase family protein [Burkholderiaceae bacterium]
MDGSFVTTTAELDALYGEPSPASIAKETDRLTPAYRALVEASPFVLLATVGPDGPDCSPRGDAPGFVRVADDRTLLMPDRRGNNRLDTLRNLTLDPRLGLLFVVPGLGETLRVRGTARISLDEALCASFAVDGRAPRSVIVVAIETVFFQCSRAVVRAGLWDTSARPAGLPTPGAMLAQASDGRVGGADYDAGLAERVRTTLY